MIYSIYKITNKINGKCYVGKTEKSIEFRWKCHLSHMRKGTNRHLYDAMRKYGENSFDVEEIEKCNNSQELNEREIFWISYYNAIDRNFGYNMAEGGTGGRLSEEVYKRIGDKIRGNGHTKESKRKISIILKLTKKNY